MCKYTYKYFYNLKFRIYEGTYIPKYETEHIIELFSYIYKKGDSVTEVGIGSGCINISISKYIDNSIAFTCIENNISAIKSYIYNAYIHNTKYTLIHEDIYNIKFLQTNILISNIPYIKDSLFKTNNEINKNINAHINVNGGEDGIQMAKHFMDNFNADYIILELGYEDQITKLKSYTKKYTLYMHIKPINNIQVFFCIFKNTHCRT